MISRSILLSLSIIALAPGLVRAQSSSAPGVPSVAADSASPAASADPKMYEDIEIFRRILDRKLHALYLRNLHSSGGGMVGMAGFQGGIMGFQGGMAGMPGMSPGTPANMSMVWVEEVGNPVEGVYLKGQGVVYTATLTSLQPPRSSGKTETPPPVSEWDRFRREVRNEKEKPKPAEVDKPLELSDLLLKALAENGRHFAQLGANESLTIVITVHEKSTPSAERKPTGLFDPPRSTPKADRQSKGHDLELLGELHMKQGQYNEALTAYRKALELDPDNKQAAALHRKLAQAYLALEKNAEARAALDRAIELLARANPDVRDKPVAKSTAVLPVKLIVSAPKNLLDQVGEKKITFEEFRRRASVETLRFGDSRR